MKSMLTSRLPVFGLLIPFAPLLMAICPLQAQSQVPVTPVAFSSGVSEIWIENWQVLGPFRAAEGKMGQTADPNRDYLKDYGQDENAVDAQSFPSLKKPIAGVLFDARVGNKTMPVNPKSNILRLASSEQDLEYAVVYAAVILRSSEEQDVAMAFGTDDNGKAWLNHELLFADANPQHHLIRSFHHLIGVHLRKGDNFLLVKAANLMSYWGLSVTLYRHDDKLLELARVNAVDSILKSAVVGRGQPLELRGDLLPSASAVHVEISDARHTVVEKGELKLAPSMSWNLDKLAKDNLYYCRVTDAGQTVEQAVYYGDLQAGYDRLADQISHISASDELVKVDLGAPLIRLKHLLVPENHFAPWWDQKVAEMFSEAEDNIANVTEGQDVFLRAGGTHFRGYRSLVDGQIQYYWINIPHYNPNANKRIPLVIVLPWTPSTNLPFLESANIAELAEDERYSMLGDEFGFAVLQIWGRGMYEGGTAIWNADVFEALNAVKRDYRIDTDRIYLTGTCEGGRQALLLAERYPGRFAAVAVDGPITNIRPRSRPWYDGLWLRYASPIAEAGELVSTPVLISHDVNNNNPPIEDSEAFAFRVRQDGGNITLIERKGGNHFLSSDFMAEKRSFFEFFKDKTRNSAPVEDQTDPSLKRFGERRGPIEDAFGGPILFVEGTQGTPLQNLAIQGDLEELRADWRESFFVDCPTKIDTEVTEDDIRGKNLFLIGDVNTNSIIKRIADKMPLQITPQGISIEGKSVSGDQLAYVYIAPNPINLSKYVIVMGMNQWKDVKGWRLHLPLNGVCDYFVFDLERSTPRLVDFGYFDRVWQGEVASVRSGLGLASR